VATLIAGCGGGFRTAAAMHTGVPNPRQRDLEGVDPPAQRNSARGRGSTPGSAVSGSRPSVKGAQRASQASGRGGRRSVGAREGTRGG